MAVDCVQKFNLKTSNGRTVGVFCFVFLMSACIWFFLKDHDPTGLGNNFLSPDDFITDGDRFAATPDVNWAMNVHARAGPWLGFSQGNQDAVLAYVFSQIGSGAKSFVEFGFSSSKYGQGTGANTELLFRQGWRGLLLDGQKENKAINLHTEWISADKIVATLKKYHVPLNVDYLSIDIDSADLWVFRAIISSSFRPRVVTVEYNSNYPIHSSFTNTGRPDYRWKGDRLYGTSLAALYLVAEEFGYALVDVVPCLDAVFVRKDELRGSPYPSLMFWKDISICRLHTKMHTSVTAKGWVVDYAAWKKRKQMTADILENAMEQLLTQRIPVIWDIPANTTNYEDGADSRILP